MIRVLIATMMLMMGAGGGCRSSDDQHYDFRLGYGDTEYMAARYSPRWGGVTPSTEFFGPLTRIWAVLPPGRVPSTAMLEFYLDGERVDVPFVELHDPAPEDQFNSDAQFYDLRGLTSGEYTIRHRRESAPAGLVLILRDPVPDDFEVVETTVFLGTPPPDAGVAEDGN